MPNKTDDNYLKKELYALIREDSSIFDFIQSGSLDGIWYWDLENPSEEWMSNRFWTTLGYDADEMPHSPDAWQGIINTDDLGLALENFNLHCENAEHTYDQIVRYKHSNGSTVWIRCRGLAIRDEAGKPVRMLGAHTDITSLKEAEELLARKNDELTAANGELNRFAFAASHDIQAPVRNLKSLLDILEEDAASQLDADNKDILSMAQGAAHRLQELTDAILNFAQVGNTSEELISFCTESMLAEIKLDLGTDLEKHNVNLQISDMPTIHALATPTRQLFQNLISNAIKFQQLHVDHTPFIGVSAVRFARGWKFSVTDNGIGIQSEYLDSVFNPFSRLNSADEYKGSGLGLALCYRAIQLHGGNIWVESEVGKGSTFIFTYPECALD